MLWQRVVDLEPLGLGADEYVLVRANARIRIQRPQCDSAQFSAGRNPETRAANPAERPTDARRSLIDSQKFLARQPTEIPGADLCIGCKGGSVKSTAHRAVAVAHIGERTTDLIPDSTAQAPTLNFHASVSPVPQRIVGHQLPLNQPTMSPNTRQNAPMGTTTNLAATISLDSSPDSRRS